MPDNLISALFFIYVHLANLLFINQEDILLSETLEHTTLPRRYKTSRYLTAVAMPSNFASQQRKKKEK